MTKDMPRRTQYSLAKLVRSAFLTYDRQEVELGGHEGKISLIGSLRLSDMRSHVILE